MWPETKNLQYNCLERKIKQAKTNKQWTGTEDWLSNIHCLTDEHVAPISVIAAFWFSSHHGSLFGSNGFSDSLYLWRFTGNNYITSAAKHRKIKRFMCGKKSVKIKRNSTPRIRYKQKTFYYFVIATYPLHIPKSSLNINCIPAYLKVLIQHDLAWKTSSPSNIQCTC